MKWLIHAKIASKESSVSSGVNMAEVYMEEVSR